MQYGLRKERTISIIDAKIIGRDLDGAIWRFQISANGKIDSKPLSFDNWILKTLKDNNGSLGRAALTKAALGRFHIKAAETVSIVKRLVEEGKVIGEWHPRSKGGIRYFLVE